MMLVFLVGLAACKGRKKTADCTVMLSALPNDVSEKLKENIVDYKDVTMRIKANYKDGNNDQSFAMNVKMRKDSFVWASVSVVLELARAYITPDSFKLLDRINKKYYAGSIHSLAQITGQDLSLTQLQDLLMANPLYALEGFQKMNDELRDDYLQQTQAGIINRIQLTGCYRPKISEYSTNLNNRSLIVDYKNFKDQKDVGIIPMGVEITAKDTLKQYNLNMEYTYISTEPIVSAPFSVPDKYEKAN